MPVTATIHQAEGCHGQTGARSYIVNLLMMYDEYAITLKSLRCKHVLSTLISSCVSARSVLGEMQIAEASVQHAQLTYVAQAQGDNLILEHSQSISAPVHDVQLCQNTCATKRQT